MQILRLPPYPLSVTYTVPDANTDYIIVIEDVSELTEIEESISSNANKQITYLLSDNFTKYDKSYALTIYEDGGFSGESLLRGDVVVQDNLEIMRPYVNPTPLAISGTATDIALYQGYENLARAIIDAAVGGFYYDRTYLEVVGQGNDYLPLWKKTHKILKVYENSQLVYDIDNIEGPELSEYTFLITKDKTAITKDPLEPVEYINRAERRYSRIPLGVSDSISMFDTEDSGNTQTVVPGVAFSEGADYILLLETGYKVVPYDIQDATLMLIDDIKCGRLDYYKRYVKNYSTDQFKIEYDKRLIDGTGNILVDKILEKYKENIVRPGVL
jgi:uncharacterized protein YfbU (UPF0304 family)